MGSGWDRGLRCLTTIGMYVILFVGWLNYTIYVMLWLLFLVERNDICPLHLAKPWQIPLFLILPCQWVADKFCYFSSFPANELLTNSAISHPSLPMSCWHIPLFLILPCQWAADTFHYFSSFPANELLMITCSRCQRLYIGSFSGQRSGGWIYEHGFPIICGFLL